MGIFKNMGQFAPQYKDDFFPKKGTPAYEGKMELRRINRENKKMIKYYEEKRKQLDSNNC